MTSSATSKLVVRCFSVSADGYGAGPGQNADNPLGALRLYQNAGFAVDVRSTGYRKPMEVNR